MWKVRKVEIVNMQSAIAKQRAKREQTYLVCLQAVEKYEKMESINT